MSQSHMPMINHGTGPLGTFADWMGYDPGLAEHEEAFRMQYGPTADQMMDVATFNLRLKSLGIDYAVVEQPPEPPPPPPGE